MAHDRVLVVEAKLSLMRLDAAIKQLTKLYRPTVELIFQKPVIMLVAFRNWIICDEDPIEMIENPEELFGLRITDLKIPRGWHVL